MRPALFCCAVYLFSAGSGEVHSEDRIYHILELTDSDLNTIDVKDGSVFDWQDVLGEPTLTARDFLTSPIFGPYDPGDLDFRIWLGWHDASDRLFVAMERVDDVYINILKQDGSLEVLVIQDSSIFFLVDGDHSGGQFMGFGGDTPWSRHAQWYSAFAETFDNGPRVFLPPQSFTGTGRWFYAPPYAEGGGTSFGENPTFSVTEFYVTPYDLFVSTSADDSVVSDLSPGKIVGFLIMVLDTDTDTGEIKSIHVLGREGIEFNEVGFPHWESAENFADGLLVGSGGSPPGGTAVESVSWARIKASLSE